MATYKLYKKTSDTAKEEIQIPASSVSGLANVATSGSYNDLIDKPKVPGVPDVVQTTGQSTTAVMSQKAVTDKLANCVTTDTDWQEITSIKKFFSNQIVLSNEIDIGASAPAPAANQYRYIDFWDKNEKRIGVVGVSIDTNKHYGAYLQAGNAASIGVLTTPDGFGYSYGPIPPDKDNTNKLATTGWVLGNTSFIPFYSDSLSTGTYRSTNLPSGCSLVYIEDRERALSGYLYGGNNSEQCFIKQFFTEPTTHETTLTIYKLKIRDGQVEKIYKNLYVSSTGAVDVGEGYQEGGTFYYKVLK